MTLARLSSRLAERVGFRLEGALRSHHIVENPSRGAKSFATTDVGWLIVKCYLDRLRSLESPINEKAERDVASASVFQHLVGAG